MNDEDVKVFGPYLRLFVEKLTGTDMAKVLEWVRGLPLEKRYVSRIVAGLRVALEDFDVPALVMDRNTLQPGDRAKVLEELERRLGQLQEAVKHFKQP